jgi:hypothetical protein
VVGTPHLCVIISGFKDRYLRAGADTRPQDQITIRKNPSRLYRPPGLERNFGCPFCFQAIQKIATIAGTGATGKSRPAPCVPVPTMRPEVLLMSNFLRIVTVTFAFGLTGLTPGRAQPAPPDPKAPDVDPPAYWSTPGDGRLVMLARNAAGFDQALPLRVRVCVTNFTGTNNSINLYMWTTTGFQSGAVRPAQPQTRQLALGECLEIDQPAALIVQDSTISGTSSGYYQLFERTAPPPEYQSPIPPATEGDAAKPPKRHEHDITIGPARSVPARCNSLPPTTPPSPSYLAYCELPLPVPVDGKPPVRGVRVCTGVNYITSVDGKTQYAAGLLELIADKAFVTTPKQSDYDYNFNPITLQGCRDIIGAKNIYFMVGPAVSGGYWDPTKVKSINVTLQTINWAAAE